jgi:hypothetical protein
VPLLRYLQAEAELEQLIRALLPVAGRKVEARLGTALPPFSESRLLDGWRKRAKDLLHAYRLQFVKHGHGSSDPRPSGRSKNTGWTAVQKATAFLDGCGERLLGDSVGDENCVRRTCYLLDIIPEARLHRQFDMISAPERRMIS